MRTILDTIIEHKRMEVLKRKGRKSLEELKKKDFYMRTPADVFQSFSADKPNIIAEFKRKSPSKGNFSSVLDPVKVVREYRQGGAVAASILTDRDFFGGSFRDLENVRKDSDSFPLLRKDFMIDSYQVHEAKAYGADIILLISAILNKSAVKELTEIAISLGLSVLLEVHSEEDIDNWIPGIAMVGVNNRDLRNFTVDIERSVDLYPKLPGESLLISESGFHQTEDIIRLYRTGFKGFLIGEHFMSQDAPGKELGKLVSNLDKLNDGRS